MEWPEGAENSFLNWTEVRLENRFVFFLKIFRK